MNILITGASGFIGNSLRLELSKFHNVYATDIVQIHESPQFFILDLLKPEEIDQKLTELNFPEIEVIIHCASILATSENHRDIKLLYNNLKITESIIKLAKRINPSKIVNFSTIGVYPNSDGVFTEESKINPGKNYEAIYGLSKFCSEELFSFLCDDIKVVNLRNAQTIGEGMRNDRIYAVMLDELNRTNAISVWGNGKRTSAFISIDYLIETIKAILLKDDFQGTFILGEKNLTYLDLAKQIIEKYGNENSQIILEDKGNRSKSYFDFSKIKKYLKNE